MVTTFAAFQIQADMIVILLKCEIVVLMLIS